MLLLGCQSDVPRLGSLSDGDPAVLELGLADLPPLPKLRPPVVRPRCRGIEPQTSTSPAIEIFSSGGLSGGGTGNVQIWEDGTVLFDGAGCPNGRRRRGKMSRARVRAVLDKLEEARFFSWPCHEFGSCSDSFITSLTVHRGGADHTVVDPGCDSSETLDARAIELVMKAVGKNACSPSCLADPAPAECR